MSAYRLKKTVNTPEVIIDEISASIFLKGICIPENPIEFFTPIIDQVSKLSDNKNVSVEVDLEYFNTSAARWLKDMFTTIISKNSQLEIKWFYDEDDVDELEIVETIKELNPQINLDLILR